VFSFPRRKARAKDTQHHKTLGSRTKEPPIPPVATPWSRGPTQGVLVHWGRVGDKCSISLCVVSLKIFNGGNRFSSRGEALAVRADGRFRHLGKADVASGANDGAIEKLHFPIILDEDTYDIIYNGGSMSVEQERSHLIGVCASTVLENSD
jgi:hypothetical protein